MPLICPICKENLQKIDSSFVCKSNHTFDISSQGYTNLLLANQKNSLSPGDNKEMAKARKDFLSKDYFLPLSQKINELTESIFKQNICVLDAGCGTGYYVSNLQKMLCENTYYGIDISKFALMIASKDNKNINYFVASIFNMPFKNQTFDLILNIFAPKADNEFKRLLNENGIILEVTPNTDHMIELKKLLYSKNTYTNKESQNFSDFYLIQKHFVTYSKNVNKNDLLSLIQMTPYFYTTKKQDLEKLNLVENINITFDFEIKIFSLKN